ncbi:MAG TPA: hypothetical protein PKY81_07320 [bacterium]|nr:hypothetical protein [bacterium]HPN30750.1 hypothetical protein [bacterium]
MKKTLIILFLLIFCGCSSKLAKKENIEIPRFIISAKKPIPVTFGNKIADKLGGYFLADLTNLQELKKYIDETNESEYFNQDKIVKKGGFIGAQYILLLTPILYEIKNEYRGVINISIDIYDIKTSALIHTEQISVKKNTGTIPMLLSINARLFTTGFKYNELETKLQDKWLEKFELKQNDLYKKILKTKKMEQKF